MKVGDRVKTTNEWNRKYWAKGLTGMIAKIRLQGPVYPERNLYVILDEPYGANKERLWFDPDHLELDDA